MSGVTQLALLLAAQHPEPELGPVTGLAHLLQTYGGWGLAALMMTVSAFLFKKYVDARDKNDAALRQQITDAQAQVKGATELVEECTKASVQQTNALHNVNDAMRAIERRLENVEKKLG